MQLYRSTHSATNLARPDEGCAVDHFMAISIGFATGIAVGLVPALLVARINITRDSFGIVLGAVAITISIAIAMLQVALALVARRSSDESASEILRNLYRWIPGSFHEIYGGIAELLFSVSTKPGSTLNLGWPVHNLGVVNRGTADTAEQGTIHTALQEMLTQGKSVTLCTMPLVSRQDKESSILKVFEVAAATTTHLYRSDIVACLSDELSFLQRLIDAARASDRYTSRGEFPFTLVWAEKAPVHWTFWSYFQVFQDGILFTSAAPQDARQLTTPNAEEFALHASEGMWIQAKAGKVLERVAGALRGRGSIDVFSSCEPRLLSELATQSRERLAHGDRPQAVLTDLRRDLFSADSFIAWPSSPDRVSSPVAAYLWRNPSSRNVVVVAPSAAGLYAYWKNDTGAPKRVRFSRYAQLCEDIRNKSSCNVLLVSQHGQADVGTWSPRSSAAELTGLVRDMPRVLGLGKNGEPNDADQGEPAATGIVILGICTGALASLGVLQEALEKKSEVLNKLKGIALWDLAPDPGFKSWHIANVVERYNITVADLKEFRPPNVVKADTLGETCARHLEVRGDTHQRFWIGGVAEPPDYSPDSTRQTHRWGSIKSIADAIGDRAVVAECGDIGHVPCSEPLHEDAYSDFLKSLSDWVEKAFSLPAIPADIPDVSMAQEDASTSEAKA